MTQTNIHWFSQFAYKQFIVKATKVQAKGKNNETSLRHFNVPMQSNEIDEYWFVYVINGFIDH